MKNKTASLSNYRFNYPTWESQTPSSQVAANMSIDTVATQASMNLGNHRDATNFWYTTQYKRATKGVLRYQQKTAPYAKSRTEGYLGDGIAITGPAHDRDLVYNMCLEKLNNKVRGGLDLSIALAEAGTTWRMIRSLQKVLTAARIHRIGNTKDIANGWLQWQYGWKPLISDVFAVADESIHIVEKQLTKVSARVTLPITGNGSVARKLNSIPVPMLRMGRGKQSCTMVVSLNLDSVISIARWTSLNPVSMAWELIPYSFVVDWLVDVGTYLRNLETALLYGTAFNSGYVSELYAYDGKEVNPAYYTWESTYTKVFVDRAENSLSERKFYRTKLTSYPFPRKPTFKVDLSSQRLFSAAALLRQFLSK